MPSQDLAPPLADLGPSEDPSSFSDSDPSSSQSCYSSEREYRIPTEREMIEMLQQLTDDNPTKRAWTNLIEFKEANKNATAEWFPFENELGLLLFVGRYDPQLSITRAIIQFFIKILRTLQENGHLNANYSIPKDASTVEKWMKNIPTPPIGKPCTLSLH